jgi:ER-bound oxygenase mpaB/B'/Rubber oxygenase, catalytic domain/PilZ domain
MTPTYPWTDVYLDPFVGLGDPLADNVMHHVMHDARPDLFYAHMAQIKNNRDDIPTELAPEVRQYFHESSRVPDWADPELIYIAQNVFARYGMPIVLTLFCIVLPEGYAVWKPTWILHRTNNLGKHLHRRIIQTAQFLLDVMAPGALGPEGGGIRSIQKVRLIHSAVRHYVVDKTDWRPEWGAPLNQEDMAATIGGFSYLSLQGLEKLNIRLSEKEQLAYLHAWSVIGSMLGVDERLRLDTMDSAAEFMRAYRRRGRAATEAGRELTQHLVQFLRSQIGAPRLRSLPEELIVYFMGKDVAAMIGLAPKNHPWLAPLLDFSRWIDQLQHRSRRLRRLSGRMTYALFERLLWVGSGGDASFHIPVALRETWNVSSLYRRVQRRQWGARCQVQLRTSSGQASEASPINVSEHGIRLQINPPTNAETDWQAMIGSRVRLHFLAPGVPAFAVGAVLLNVRANDAALELGLRFARRDFFGRRRLRRLIDAQNEQREHD